MKLEAKTINILKNFTTINPSILFTPGNVLATISPQKTIYAKASISEEFETQFGIFDLSRFLSVISLLNDPDLEIHDKSVKISNGKQQVVYVFSDPSVIVSPPAKSIKFDKDTAVKFNLSQDNLQNIMKAVGVLSLPEVHIEGDGSKIYLKGANSENPTGDTYKIEVGETDKEFSSIFKVDNLKLMPTNYTVYVGDKSGYFKSDEIEYWIAVESKKSK